MKIVGHNYKVKFIDKLRGYEVDTRTYSGNEVYGQTNYDKNAIELNSSMCKNLQEEVLVHEIIHAIIFHSHKRNDHDEAVIQAISNGLYRLGVGKFLMEKEGKKVTYAN